MSDKKTFYISRDQFEKIRQYSNIIDACNERIAKLCSSKKDDIVYGFELGQIQWLLTDNRMVMLELEDAIRQQKL